MVSHSHKDGQNKSGRVSNTSGTLSNKSEKFQNVSARESRYIRKGLKQARKGSDICKGLKHIMNVLKQARNCLKCGRKTSGSAFITQEGSQSEESQQVKKGLKYFWKDHRQKERVSNNQPSSLKCQEVSNK